MSERTGRFHILALAPLSGRPEALSAPPVTGLDLEGLDRAAEALGPSISVPVDRTLCPEGALTFTAAGVRSFSPKGVLKACPFLERLSPASDLVEEETRKGTPEDAIARIVRERWPDAPPDLFDVPSEPSARGKPQDGGVVDDILSMVVLPEKEHEAPARGGEGSLKARMERRMARLVKAVFHDEGFRRLEASWRGLETLMRQGPVRPGGGVTVDLCPVEAETLGETLQGLKGALSANPPNLLLVDLPFESSPPHVERLEQVADLAAELLAPAAVWVGARFFHIPTWRELKTLPYISHHLEGMEYARWRRLADHDGARWTAVLVNRFLARPAYGKDNPPRPVFFEEEAPLWIAPVWALGALMAQSAVRWGWPSRFTDPQTCALRDLAVDSDREEGPCSTEALLSEDRAAEFVRAGFTPLLGVRGRDTAAIPRETALCGEAVAPQAFLNALLGHLFRLRAERSEPGEAPSEAALVAHLKSLFHHTGHEPPEDLSVIIEAGPPGGAARVHIELTPPASLLKKARPMAFDLAW